MLRVFIVSATPVDGDKNSTSIKSHFMYGLRYIWGGKRGSFAQAGKGKSAGEICGKLR